MEVKEVLSFLKSSARYVQSGMKNVDAQTYLERMKVSSTCIHRNNNKCTRCGCNLPLKCKWKTEKCPINKW